MIPAISSAIDKRFLLRSLTTCHKRIKYHNNDPSCQAALDEASWSLNPIGLKLLNDNFKLCFKRWENMEIGHDGVISEKYENSNERQTYNTDGCTCDCSYFKQMYYCRHIPFYRLKTSVPLFELNAFHHALTKEATNVSNLDLYEDVTHESSAPPSPGISMVRSEEKRSKKTVSQSQKFNMAFDLGKELAEVTSLFDIGTFKMTLESNKNYLKQVRKGISKPLFDYLKSPDKFKIVPVPELRNDKAAHLVSVRRDQQPEVSQGSEHDHGEQRDLSDFQRASIQEELNVLEPSGALSNEVESVVSPTSVSNSNAVSTAAAMALPHSPLSCMQSGQPEAAVEGGTIKVREVMKNIESVSISTTQGSSSLPAFDLEYDAELVNNLALFLVCANIACQASCSSKDLTLCPGCQSVAFCGEDCVHRGWNTHKHVCKHIKNVSLAQKKKMIRFMLTVFEGDVNDNIVEVDSAEAPDKTSPKQNLSPQGLPSPFNNEPNYHDSSPDSEPSSSRGGRSFIVDNQVSGKPSSPPDHIESAAFTFDDEDLPDIPYTQSQNMFLKEPFIRFQTTIRGKGRPILTRQADRKKFNPNSVFVELYDKLPMKKTTEEKTRKERKTRSDKGKKRGRRQGKEKDMLESSDEENLPNDSSGAEAIHLRKPRAPKNDKTLRKQYSQPVRPEKCITCHFPLNYDELDHEERVVNCVKCKSFIHQSCKKNCGFCENEEQ